MTITTARIGIRLAVVATAVALAVGLTGCIQSTTALPGTTASATATRSASPSSSASETPSPTPSSGAPTFVENCSILLTPDQVYAFNPNFVADPSYKPKAGSIPAKIAANGGQTCGWLNESSGSLLEVAIATPTATALNAAKTAASGGTPIDANGKPGYFAVVNGVGSAQFFFGSFWLDVASGDFTAVADAQSVYPTVVQNQVTAGG
jgi:hypothetical protein